MFCLFFLQIHFSVAIVSFLLCCLDGSLVSCLVCCLVFSIVSCLACILSCFLFCHPACLFLGLFSCMFSYVLDARSIIAFLVPWNASYLACPNLCFFACFRNNSRFVVTVTCVGYFLENGFVCLLAYFFASPVASSLYPCLAGYLIRLSFLYFLSYCLASFISSDIVCCNSCPRDNFLRSHWTCLFPCQLTFPFVKPFLLHYLFSF